MSIPSGVEEALAESLWRRAMNEEIEALQRHRIWELILLAEGERIVGCKWAYTVSLNQMDV